MLPRDIKNCRVLTFNYSASVTSILGSTSSDGILQHAHTLVAELVADRYVRVIFSSGHEQLLIICIQLEDAMERPIIFICHSLGGIIVKRVRASPCGP